MRSVTDEDLTAMAGHILRWYIKNLIVIAIISS
jgi:hypothetical protein